MKKYAVVSKEVVVNIIDADDSYEPLNNENELFVLLSDEDKAYIGRGYDETTGTFEPSLPTIIINPSE